MPGKTITLAQWRRELGETVPIQHAPRAAKLPQIVITRAVKSGELPLHTFRAVDGRVFKQVRVSDLEKLHDAQTRKPLTIEAMAGALQKMIRG